MDKVPEERCGFELETGDLPQDYKEVCCWRDNWEDSDYCIFHARDDGKPINELKKSFSDSDERLDGSILRELRFQEANFSGCSLVKADLSNSNFALADFSDTNLMYANLSNGDFSNADFTQSDLYSVTAKDTHLNSANFENAVLSFGEFKESIAIFSDFSSSKVIKADFSGVQMLRTDFSNTVMEETDFTEGYLRSVNFTDADIRGSTFAKAYLEDATFARADLRNADLRSSRLYQTLFSDTRINSNTDFGEKSAYEDPDTELGENYENTSRWEAAAWVYRRLQDLHEENAMSERARDFHVRKEEAHRQEYRENGEWFQWGVYTLNRYLTNHGESLKHVVAWSVGIIVACGLLYPFTGGIETANGTNQVAALSDLSLDLFAQSFYYSMVTFTTLGYGNPAGTGAKLLVGLESLAGTLLIALFVFVLGRRVAR